MSTPTLVPAAQYLRMSTEHQQYSLDNQAASNKTYAESRGFVIIQTYTDAGKSGLHLKQRPALRELLQDVLHRDHRYKAILVYDVSRWGRFQDTDEAAHYEFICKQAGVPVHYCAETFDNDNALPSLIMKSLKRTMASEYSRELSVKCYEALKRHVLLGYRAGAVAGYGLRRMMLRPSENLRVLLRSGEYKGLRTDRVILVPGPAEEVAVVREMYRMVVQDGKGLSDIRRTLNRGGIKWVDGRPWSFDAVKQVLRNPKYTGFNIWGRTSQKLRGGAIRLPRQQWIVTADAFEPIIDRATFDEAQRRLRNRTNNKSNEDLLNDLRRLRLQHGKLTEEIIDAARGVAAVTTYMKRFGSIRRTFDLLGYKRSRDFHVAAAQLGFHRRDLREDVIAEIIALFPSVKVIRRFRRWRPILQLRGGSRVSILMCPSTHATQAGGFWTARPVRGEAKNVTLFCLLNDANDRVVSHYMGLLDTSLMFRMRENRGILVTSTRLRSLKEFHSVARRLCAANEKRRVVPRLDAKLRH